MWVDEPWTHFGAGEYLKGRNGLCNSVSVSMRLEEEGDLRIKSGYG